MVTGHSGQRTRVDGVDTCEAAVTTLTATPFAGTTISDGHLSRATPAASGGNSGSAMARSGCTDAARSWNFSNAVSGCSSSDTTTARNAHQPGGFATARKARILRRRHRLEGLERCLQKLCVCLRCAAGLTLGMYERSEGPMLNATLAQSEAPCSHSCTACW